MHSFIHLVYAPADRDLLSFPTRRSSDLAAKQGLCINEESKKVVIPLMEKMLDPSPLKRLLILLEILRDRKSTRLNSSHLVISYAVFCLKKKIYIPTYSFKT